MAYQLDWDGNLAKRYRQAQFWLMEALQARGAGSVIFLPICSLGAGRLPHL
jgi:hypothetical protein